MLSADYRHQYIDWWHSPIIGSNENFDHEGNLTTQILNAIITIGLNDYFNISINQMFGMRTMGYNSEESLHHRTEDSTSDFDNAHGGTLGDTKINLKYLLTNTGKQKGSRIFIGSGISIPSKNTLTASPYLKDENEESYPHRHFSLSDGAFKYLFELQLFYKQNKFPTFYGLSFNIDYPLKENDYGYLPSTSYNANLLLYTKKMPIANSPIGFNIAYIKTSKAFWNGEYAKNSDSEIIAPGISFIFNTKNKITYGFRLNKEFVTSVAFGDNALEQRVDSWSLNLSVRKVLDYTIPFLYY